MNGLFDLDVEDKTVSLASGLIPQESINIIEGVLFLDLSQESQVSILILSTTGGVEFSHQGSFGEGSNRFQLPLKALPSGRLFVQVRLQGHRFTSSLVNSKGFVFKMVWSRINIIFARALNFEINLSKLGFNPKVLAYSSDFEDLGEIVLLREQAPVSSSVSISGDAVEGATLTGTYTYSDAEGDLESGTTFRWLRDGVAIISETSLTYMIVSADSGAVLTFEVTPIALTGSPLQGAVVTSTGTSAVSGFSAPVSSSVSISGDAVEGATLTGTYTYSDAEGDLESGTTFRWLRDGVAISGETSLTYVIVLADKGAVLTFEVTPNAATGSPSQGAVVTSTGTSAVSGFSAPVSSSVSISGNAVEGSTLTGTYTYSDAEGDLESGTTFRWLRDGVAISGETSLTYVIVSADSGAVLTFEVTPNAATGSPSQGAVVTSTGTSAVSGFSAPVSSSVSISGNAVEGATLTGTYTYSDAEGDLESGTTFRWLRDGVAIISETSLTYVIVSADSGAVLTFEVTPNAATGSPSQGAVVTSTGTSAVSGFSAPVSSSVSISGNAVEGATLTGTYTYSDAEGDLESGTTFRWLRDGVAISGETSLTYVIVLADKGAVLTFEVTPIALTGSPLQGAVVTSTGTSAVSGFSAPVSSSVSISGNAVEGATLTGTYTYSDAEGDLESGTTFRWLRDGVAISGATSLTYIVQPADTVGSSLTFEVTHLVQTKKWWAMLS